MSIEKLQQDFQSFLDKLYPKLVFRPYQKAVVFDIIKTYLEGEKDVYLLQAPTGSGKSVIALVVSHFLEESGCSGYILASDLSLHAQYVDNFNAYGLSWGHIKGVDNYECVVNHEKFSLGDCKNKSISYEKAEELDCFQRCGYLTSRKKAIASKVTLLTYSYALIQRNYVEEKMQGAGRGVPFPQRDFVICDEAHKVIEIVQNHFSPKIGWDVYQKAVKLVEFLKTKKLPTPKYESVEIQGVIREIFKEEDKTKLHNLLYELQTRLADILNTVNDLPDRLKKLKVETVPREWLNALGLKDFIKDVHCKVEDYNVIIKRVGSEKLVKNPAGPETVVFNCLEENYMMNKHFHKKFGFKILMTATMGDPKSFGRSLGIKSARYQNIPSTFNYEKSPIIYYSGKKLSYAEKEKNLPWAIQTVKEIINSEKENSGIIHTGSYEFTKKLYDSLSPFEKRRIILYEDSATKETAINEFYKKGDAILIGPSLLEGLDLVEDRSRFQIFFKVPYPSLQDKFVSEKLKVSPEWYDWKTTISILQGVGRSIRTPEDYARTYIIDGCFSILLRKNRDGFPKEFLDRIHIIRQ
jgi:Rad3-related DNA helicase